MTQGVFVTGTDTEVGKTLIASALLHVYRNAGLRAVGMKPVAAGCDEQGHNEDVESARSASSIVVAPELSCPYLFKEAIAPHIAARHEGRRMDLKFIIERYRLLIADAAAVVVEGVGGFLVPLNDTESAAGLAQQLALPMVLVVGLRLGCINHTLLTQEAIEARGLHLLGWVANHIDPHMQCVEENIDTLRRRLRAPLLADVPYQASPNAAHVASLFDRKLLGLA